MTHTRMTRSQFHHNDLTLSYLDTGGEGQTLIALHALWMEAATYTLLASALSPEWRIIAMDQRGHGYSDHALSYTRKDYIGDVAALVEHLEVDKVVLLGNSLGGVNAYQFAAWHPERVKAVVIEDIGAHPDADASFVLVWEGIFPSREALEERIGQRLAPYLLDSFRSIQTAGGLRSNLVRCLNHSFNSMVTTGPTGSRLDARLFWSGVRRAGLRRKTTSSKWQRDGPILVSLRLTAGT